ncbi:SGNH/GDSL hydrolase family protein [Gryllotalpicola protaetiae]|uniref:SGNH/GDSL hydrolase family protein n=2 Tax=Gryllotalpicola protaetiae TaxID=2419771 RepID=A0A387BLT3_9MICO|nr:SGNH/GDSL hydrolase family protein [Gryllotalpicola protaetiae]
MVNMPELSTFTRYVALGDSFTEGLGDPYPDAADGFRGWADRVAEVLAAKTSDFAYANLAVRGKLVRQILADQVDAAVALRPDLITISAGGNDVIRPGTDPDEIAAIFEQAIARLATTGATIVVFTGVDVGWSGTFKAIRGKVAIYNEDVRKIAAKYGCLVADQWSLTEIQDMRMWSIDRLHMSPLGHQAVARLVLRTLGVPNDLPVLTPAPVPPRSWREARVQDLQWAREYAWPWVVRRLKHVSSGDGLPPKRPDLAPLAPLTAPESVDDPS